MKNTTEKIRFARMFYLYRSELNISLRDMAQSLGISAATLHRFESGRHVSADVLLKVFDYAFAKAPGREE